MQPRNGTWFRCLNCGDQVSFETSRMIISQMDLGQLLDELKKLKRPARRKSRKPVTTEESAQDVGDTGNKSARGGTANGELVIGATLRVMFHQGNWSHFRHLQRRPRVRHSKAPQPSQMTRRRWRFNENLVTKPMLPMKVDNFLFRLQPNFDCSFVLCITTSNLDVFPYLFAQFMNNVILRNIFQMILFLLLIFCICNNKHVQFGISNTKIKSSILVIKFSDIVWDFFRNFEEKFKIICEFISSLWYQIIKSQWIKVKN